MRLLTLGLVFLVVYAFWGGQVAGQGDDPPGVVGNTYTSPIFGYSLSWDGDYWELYSAASSSDELSDHVELDVRGEPLSRLFLDAFMWNREGDPHDAAGWVEKKFAEMAASVDDDSVITNLKQAEAGGQPIGGHDATSAYAVYEYQYLGSQLAAYYDCRELIPGVAGLCSWFVTPRDQFNSQVPHVRAVLDTLTAATVNPCSLLPVGTPSLIDPRAAATPTTASVCEATELVDPHVVATPLASSGDALFMHYADQSYRTDDAAAFLVFFTNLGTVDVINPQTRVVVSIDSHDYPCQGYIDPDSQEAVLEAAAVSAKPLIIPAKEGEFVTILCRVLETNLDNATLTLH